MNVNHALILTPVAAVLAIAGAGCISATSGSQPASTPTQHQSSSTPAQQSSQSAQAATPKPKPRVLLSISGSGTQNTRPFTLNGHRLSVTYSYWNNTSGFGGDNFIADVVSSDDDLSIVNEIGKSGGKTTQLYPDLSFGASHQYHLEVSATGHWHFKIVEAGS